MKPLIIVSTDGHIGTRVAGYRDYLEPQYRDLIPELVAAEQNHHTVTRDIMGADEPERLELMDDRNRIRGGGLAGSWDPVRRLEELDAEGIAAEVVFPGTGESMTPFFYQFNRVYPEDVRWAGVKAYHRWLADAIVPAKGRLIATADAGASSDMKESLAELRFAAKQGFRATFVPGHVSDPNLPSLVDGSYYDPFWAACDELNLVLTIHVGWGTPQGEIPQIFTALAQARQKAKEAGKAQGGYEEAFAQVKVLLDEENPDSIFSTDLSPRRALWQLIFTGVFDRYPNLKLNVAECRGDWVPEYKSYLDARFVDSKRRPKLKMKPSEYFGKNVFITPTAPRRIEVEKRHGIGVDSFMFGSDYPHVESTWPNTLTWLQAAMYDVPENELRAMLGENAIRVYGLDRTWLAAIAAKIGPSPSEIIGHDRIDERIINDFDHRAGYRKPSVPLDQNIVNEKLDEDLTATAA